MLHYIVLYSKRIFFYADFLLSPTFLDVYWWGINTAPPHRTGMAVIASIIVHSDMFRLGPLGLLGCMCVFFSGGGVVIF
jgi:hypothetical protein